MPASREEDRSIAKAVRSAVARTSIDIAELDVSCANGYVELMGRIRAPRGAEGHFNIRKEFEIMKNIARNVRGVRDINASRIRIVE